MDSGRTRQIVETWFADIGSGNLERVLATLSPSVYHELPRHERNAVIPNLGVHIGRDAVAESFRMRGEASADVEYVTRDVVVEGDKAYVVTWARMRHRRTGVEFGIEATHRLTVDAGGQISYWKVYFDPTPEVAAFDDDLDQRLLAAVRAGESQEVAQLISVGAQVDARDQDTGLTALMIAAGRGDATSVRLLLEGGADVHAMDAAAGGTPLHKAVQGGDLESVRLLVDAGAQIDAVVPTTGHTPLLDAFWYKMPDIAEFLLAQDAGLNLTTHYGFSMRDHIEYALQANALGTEKLAAAEHALRARLERDERQAAEQALMSAVVAGDLERVRELLAQGVAVDERSPVLNGFNDAHTPLLVAARDGHVEIVRELLAAGADVNATEPTFGAVPLHKAVYNGHAEITQILVHTAGVDLDFRGPTNGYTPLLDAIWHGYEECSRILLAAGARTDLVGHDGKTPAALAAEVFGAGHALTTELS
ncbi:ankyrin repeat domain-containing protein [Saccharopolyspora erythraea]|uniref:ankyrin repeat domain-containing protein n=1 Tax=Saccharopolyspora erythraea TaxID=1836 RepID=UPI001BAB11B5|nr:ankyrin repeat domain-containing protein [Saccharopolyspora erythraea]QUH02162.1 ankyrin repeat domain-containing protein [Saccharopolyspora erythraea]